MKTDSGNALFGCWGNERPSSDEIKRGAPVAAVWLFLASQGGFWTAREIRAALPDEYFGNLSSSLHHMAQSRQVVRFQGDDGLSFGVTNACKTPGMVTLGDIIATGLVAA
jgi:hypothetical protein